MRAWLNLRYHSERYKLFASGLKRHGYKPHKGLPDKVKPGDILVTWGRVGLGDSIAKCFESCGMHVLVVENSTWGNDFHGRRWYHMARNQHNTAGNFSVYGDDRWGDLNVDLADFRKSGETVILPQRGIGSEPVKMPGSFPKKALLEHGGRIRRHPGRRESIPLEVDLACCQTVVTWGSGAAVKALMMGCRVISYMPNWIAEQDNTIEGRLAMFRRLAWAQWELSEIESGFAFDSLMGQ